MLIKFGVFLVMSMFHEHINLSYIRTKKKTNCKTTSIILLISKLFLKTVNHSPLKISRKFEITLTIESCFNSTYLNHTLDLRCKKVRLL